jgi:hypothetical protein
MCEKCPYCGREYSHRSGLCKHALEQHSEAVLSHWVEQHNVSPIQTGQQSLGEATA